MKTAARAVLAAVALLASGCTTSQYPLEAQLGPREPHDPRLVGTWALAGGGTTIATVTSAAAGADARIDELHVSLHDHEKGTTEAYRLRIARFNRQNYASALRIGGPAGWTLYRFKFEGDDTLIVDTTDDAFLWRAARGGAIRGITDSDPAQRVSLTASPRELREFVRLNPAMFGGRRLELSRVPF
jgi:hypothetical protein